MTGNTLQQHQADVILQAYHEHLRNLPKVNVLSDELLGRMADIWQMDARHRERGFWDFYFGKQCRASGYVMGRDYNERKGPFKANLAWLLDKKNFKKIMNGEFS